MKLIVGLGNPGEKYKNNRHNVGHMVIDELKKLGTNELKNVKVVRSDSFMNDSGSYVLSQYTKYNIQCTDLFVIFDDLDIKFGEYKIQFGKGPKDHKGLLDIYEKLDSMDFWHVRVGVENRDSENKIPGEKYVLQDFTNQESEILGRTIYTLTKELCKKLEK